MALKMDIKITMAPQEALRVRIDALEAQKKQRLYYQSPVQKRP